jgi:hypothetical protein
MPSRPALLVLALLGSGGCVAHTVRIEPLAPDPETKKTTVMAGSRPVDPFKEQVITHPMPIELPVESWRARGDVLERGEVVARTPLTWWQRFPFDAATDLLPIHFECAARVLPTPVAVPAHDDDALTEEARRHGFAHTD